MNIERCRVGNNWLNLRNLSWNVPYMGRLYRLENGGYLMMKGDASRTPLPLEPIGDGIYRELLTGHVWKEMLAPILGWQ